MFGKSVFNKFFKLSKKIAYPYFGVFIFLFLNLQIAYAQSGTGKVVVILQGALVYKNADFDAPVIAELKKGQILDVALKKKGYIYRLRVKPGVIGYISDVDVKLTDGKNILKESLPPLKSTTKKSTEKKSSEKAEAEKAKKPFLFRRYRGFVLEMMNYTENTLGGNHSAQVPFYGIKWSGMNTVMAGEVFMDANILFAPIPPKYYADYTGNGTSGWIININTMFMNTQKQGKHHFTFFGYGPMFKYSHFDATLTNPTTGKNSNYSLDDMSVGAVFAIGIGFEVGGEYAVRSDVKYYMESKQYASFGLGIQKDF